MKTSISFSVLLTVAILSAFPAQSQPDHRTAYAVTDSVTGGAKWNFLRRVDLRNGIYSNEMLRLLYGNDTLPVNSMCNGVAAIAHDKKNKRVYFTPMLIDRLSYVDLRTMSIHTVSNNFAGTGPKKPDQSNIITRMTIADDDLGYALTNDGKQLIRFSTRNNHHVTNLGSLVDAPGNTVSVHEACSSFGGDIIADDEGHLYLITVSNAVFKINIRTRVARYKGDISGLPESFTTNGAAVNERNSRVVIASATDASDLFSLNISTLHTRELHAGNPRLTADLTSSNILNNSNHHREEEDHEGRPSMIVHASIVSSDKVQLYPNPVTSNEFKIEFRNTTAGSYKIDLIGINGKIVLSNTGVAGGKGNVVAVQVPESAARGIYVVRITGNNSEVIFSEKIILQ